MNRAENTQEILVVAARNRGWPEGRVTRLFAVAEMRLAELEEKACLTGHSAAKEDIIDMLADLIEAEEQRMRIAGLYDGPPESDNWKRAWEKSRATP